MSSDSPVPVPVPDPSWTPAPGDSVEVQRLKLQCVRTFAKHAGGRGLEGALSILLTIASADGEQGRARVNARTRRLAALDYAKLMLMGATLGDRKGGSEVAPPMPPNEDAGVAIVRIREVEAILSDDEALRGSIRLLRRASGNASGLRLGDVGRQVEDGGSP